MEELAKLKQMFEQGFLSKDEYDQRRHAVIDSMTGTSGDKKSMTSPQVAAEAKRQNDLYAGKHFSETNTDALKHGNYLVIQPPMAHNRHMHTNDTPDNPFSYITAPVPIDPKRAYQAPTNVKQGDGQTLVFADQKPGAPDRVEQVLKLEEDKKKLSWELFYAAAVNDVPKIKELLDRGADVNQRDFDSEATPIIVAAAKGQKHAVYYMVERGALPNAQNHRGETALHEAVKNKFNEMALWLVKHGADIDLENYRSYSPYDLALPWLQKEMKDERDHYVKEQKTKLKAKQAEQQAALAQQQALQAQQAQLAMMAPAQNSPQAAGLTMRDLQPQVPAQFEEKYGVPQHKRVIRGENGAPIDEVLTAYQATQPAPAPKAPVTQEVIKVYLKNNSYKTCVVSSDQTAKDLADSVAEKLNMAKFANYFDVIETVKGADTRLDPNINVLSRKKKWPLLLGPSGNETELHCRFVVVPKRGTPENITMMYRDAIYGNQK